MVIFETGCRYRRYTSVFELHGTAGIAPSSRVDRLDQRVHLVIVDRPPATPQAESTLRTRPSPGHSVDLVGQGCPVPDAATVVGTCSRRQGQDRVTDARRSRTPGGRPRRPAGRPCPCAGNQPRAAGSIGRLILLPAHRPRLSAGAGKARTEVPLAAAGEGGLNKDVLPARRRARARRPGNLRKPRCLATRASAAPTSPDPRRVLRPGRSEGRGGRPVRYLPARPTPAPSAQAARASSPSARARSAPRGSHAPASRETPDSPATPGTGPPRARGSSTPTAAPAPGSATTGPALHPYLREPPRFVHPELQRRTSVV